MMNIDSREVWCNNIWSSDRARCPLQDDRVATRECRNALFQCQFLKLWLDPFMSTIFINTPEYYMIAQTLYRIIHLIRYSLCVDVAQWPFWNPMIVTLRSWYCFVQKWISLHREPKRTLKTHLNLVEKQIWSILPCRFALKGVPKQLGLRSLLPSAQDYAHARQEVLKVRVNRICCGLI